MSKLLVWTNSQSEENIKHIAFIEHQHVCALCGSYINIRVLAKDEESAVITEQADCPECKIKTRVKSHTIQ